MMGYIDLILDFQLDLDSNPIGQVLSFNTLMDLNLRISPRLKYRGLSIPYGHCMIIKKTHTGI